MLLMMLMLILMITLHYADDIAADIDYAYFSFSLVVYFVLSYFRELLLFSY